MQDHFSLKHSQLWVASLSTLPLSQDFTAHSSFLNALCSPPTAYSFCLRFRITVVVSTLSLFWERRILQKKALAGKVGQMKAGDNLRFKKYLHKRVKKKHLCCTETLSETMWVTCEALCGGSLCSCIHSITTAENVLEQKVISSKISPLVLFYLSVLV